MSTERERAEFEAWWANRGLGVGTGKKAAWYAYQAGRAARKRRDEPVGWIFDDDLPDNYPYDAMYPYSIVDGVRMFPVYAPQPAERDFKTCRHCGYDCKPSQQEKGWHPLEQPADPNDDPNTAPISGKGPFKTASALMEAIRDPVKVPSDIELRQMVREQYNGDPVEFARALLARYGQPAQSTDLPVTPEEDEAWRDMESRR